MTDRETNSSGTIVNYTLGEEIVGDLRGTTSQLTNAPAVALMATLLAAQYLGIAETRTASVDPRPTTHLTAFLARDLFDALVSFHLQLAESQEDLPADAARILRDNLWRLYG